MENVAELTTQQKVFTPEEYTVDGAKVQIRCSETRPKEGKNLDLRKAIISYSSWNWIPELKIMKDIAQKIADYSGQTVYNISSKTDQLGPDAGLIEAKGATQFLNSHNLSEIIIVGHSEGGLKAVDLVAELEKNNPQTTIDGLVLMDALGLYNQDPKTLMRNYLTDPKFAAKEFRDTQTAPPKGGAMQFLHGLWEDIKFFGANYPRKLKEEVITMAQVNLRLKEIKTPVLIITGDRDYVSDHHKYVPSEAIDKRAGEAPSDEPTQQQMMRRSKARNELIRENILPKSEKVSMIVLSKGAHHAGVTDIRINQVANVVSGIFDRMKRSS